VQRPAQRGLRPRQLRGQLQQLGRGGAAAAQRLVAQLGSFAAGQPERVSDAPLRAVEPDALPGAQVEDVPAEVEGGRVEAVPADRGVQRRSAGAARQRDVDLGRDVVYELVPGQRRTQAQRGPRCAGGDGLQVVVAAGEVGPLVQAAAQAAMRATKSSPGAQSHTSSSTL
jgi:hypothetical protein